jgi:flagellar motor switch protein FliM
MVLVATFSLSAAGGIGPGELSVALPLNALRAALGRLDRQNQFDAMQQGQTPIQRRQLDRVVAESVLELRVAMGTAAVTVGDIMGLRSGDILVLDQAHGDLMSGRIAGRERLLGRPGRIGKKLAFLVERVLPAGQATPDKE